MIRLSQVRYRWILVVVALTVGFANAAKAKAPQSANDPLSLDLTKHRVDDTIESLTGHQIFDGIPFEIVGRARLFGNSEDSPLPTEDQAPASFADIPVGRTFEDLYLIHHTSFPGVEGEPVAFMILTYADETGYIAPLRYGVHMRDWFHLPSFALENPTDPHSKICWRHAPLAYKAPIQIFKTRLENPFPTKEVTMLDFVSAGNSASYCLLAVTVANRDARDLKQDSPPKKWDEPVREFNGKLTVQVVDDDTGEPLEHVLLKPSMHVDNEGVFGSPFYTSTEGKGTILYRHGLTKSIYLPGSKAGFEPNSKNLTCDANGDFAKECVLRLSPQE